MIRPLGRDGLEQLCKDVREGLFDLRIRLQPRKPIVSEKTYGRNEWVKAVYFADGHEVTTKFKNVKSDFENKLCRVERV